MTLLLVRSGTSLFGFVGSFPAVAGRDAGHMLRRACDAAQRSAEIGKVHKREQQAGHPEDVLVREERQKPQHRDNLELQFLRPMCHPLGERVQAKEQISEGEHGDDQRNSHHDHQNVSLARRRDEWRQVVGGRWVNGCAQRLIILSATASGNEAAIYLNARLETFNQNRWVSMRQNNRETSVTPRLTS